MMALMHLLNLLYHLDTKVFSYITDILDINIEFR